MGGVSSDGAVMKSLSDHPMEPEKRLLSRTAKTAFVQQRPFIFFGLALISGIVGFGGGIIASSRLWCTSGFLTAFECGVIVGLAKFLSVIFLVFFVVSLLFGEHIRHSH
jgi:uncharacterized membrane protein YtjA (UPF0391 family)